MNLREAVVVAKQQITDLFAPVVPQNLRLEEFLYDDHLAVWTLTIGCLLPEQEARSYKIVRVSEGNRSVLSIRDR